jgi:hypothetical protein
MTPTNVLKASIKVCMFDQYGTIVDMQTGLTEIAGPYLESKGWKGNPNYRIPRLDRPPRRRERKRIRGNSLVDVVTEKFHQDLRQLRPCTTVACR